MKRVIREVITLIRIERWLVKDEVSRDQPAAAEPDLTIEEAIIEAQDAKKEDIRVIAQRVLEARQWEVAPPKGGRSKRSTNARQTPKAVE